ncbi:hypothetical protein [Psittacicella gerlachiana]|uniref:Uncharacterized protein n=1 Tax=Psittacicella gerlachiana TaxID=2028574 RepID=A0A3A1Y9H8_9GAMM|nr:hypothetical protein [Psittacicella gerlachiana]RIY33848.1 hypothetical protein CKF59_06085 [Psittacicella gerlachiana]
MKLKTILITALLAVSSTSALAAPSAKSIEVQGQQLPIYTKAEHNLIKVKIGEQTKLPYTSYRVENVQIIAPAYLSLAEINQALHQVQLNTELSQTAYLATQYNYDADREK